MNEKEQLTQAANALDKHQLSEAITLCMTVLNDNPNISDAWQILSVCSLKKNNIKQALEHIDKAISINPQRAHYFCIKGTILKKAQLYHEAINATKKAIQMKPHSADFYFHLGILYQEKKHFQAAKSAYEKAYTIAPNNHKIGMNLGALLRDHHHYHGALQQYDKLLQVDPNNHRAIYAKGIVYKRQYDFKTAKAYFKQSIALDPTNKDYHFSLSLVYLQEGNFIAGWREYEYRIQLSNFKELRKKIQQPQWKGQYLSKHQSLLLWAEQGFGDTLTFIRYLPLIQERCPVIHLLCHPELKTLFERLPNIDSISLFKEKIPATTYQLPLLSAPHIFKTTRETIPRTVPYLPRYKKTDLFAASHFNVGIVWAGKPIPDKNRSCDLKHFIPLFNLPGITFYSLQLGKEKERLKEKPFTQYAINDMSSSIKDFNDTARLITELDLLIAIDTAIVHLAGALNHPTWVLLQKHVDWRWQPQQDTSAWYPSHRLFRQKKQGEWETVFQSVTQALQDKLLYE